MRTVIASGRMGYKLTRKEHEETFGSHSNISHFNKGSGYTGVYTFPETQENEALCITLHVNF